MMMLIPLAFALPTTYEEAVGAELQLPDIDDGPMAIIDGEDSTRLEWPMAAGVILETTLFGQGQTSTICSSTLIAPDVVMLAAHCLDEQIYQLQMIQSGLGPDALGDLDFWISNRVNLSQYVLGAPAQNLPADAVRAQEVVLHPNWNFLTLQPGLAENFDIALMFLETPILDRPLGYLPQPDSDEIPVELGEEVVIVGWGKQVATSGAQPPPPGTFGIKQQGISTITERRPYEIKIGEEDTTRKCQGDSGGPTFKEVPTDSPETWRVIGITSHNYANTDNCDITSGVDTRVSYYLDWIEEEMSSRCEDGSRTWCEIPGILPPPRADGTLAWEAPANPIDDDEEVARKGCACQSGPSPMWGALLLGPALLLRRR